jgi:hypothetical protein
MKIWIPYSQHIFKKPTLNDESNRWECHRSQYGVDQNVVLYHL